MLEIVLFVSDVKLQQLNFSKLNIFQLDKVTLEKFRQLAETSYGQFLMLSFNLIRNATFQNQKVQDHVVRGDLPAILSRLWSHCTG